MSWHKLIKKWSSIIGLDNKSKHLGYYTNEEDAALAYNKAAVKTHGEFANLNIIKPK